MKRGISMKNFVPFEKLSKKAQKQQLKEHRKPPIPANRPMSASKSEFEAKKLREKAKSQLDT